jgi:PLP dependent protein
MVNKAFIEEFKQRYPDVTLIAVTKYTDIDGVQAFVDAGMMDFGENRAEALQEKKRIFPSFTWHFIGHLQTNKVKLVLPHINVLHSLDRLSLALEIEKRATTTLDCFVQVKTTTDDKYGCALEEVDDLLESLKPLTKIRVIGFMTMAALNGSDSEIKASFETINNLRQTYQLPNASMGMSDDYKVALSLGSTHVRLGRILYEGEDNESF